LVHDQRYKYVEVSETAISFTRIFRAAMIFDAGNRLTCLPPQLLDITSLRNLFLGANQITELSAGINRLR
jgi:hypothetical protein